MSFSFLIWREREREGGGWGGEGEREREKKWIYPAGKSRGLKAVIEVKYLTQKLWPS